MGFKKLFWTAHSKEKMKFYNISEQRVRRILKSPERTEKGIAENTVAVMQKAGGKRKYELWAMFQDTAKQRKIISAWRYPGETKPGELIIPEGAL